MMPPEAKTYFEYLSSSASADAWADLDKRQKEFERHEFSRGKGPYGAGFSAQLAVLYEESLSYRARTIANTLETVHKSFNSPLGDGVDAQLLDWGTLALADAYHGLKGAYVRHLEHFSVNTPHLDFLNHTYALAQTTVANLPRRYLWELRNVPAKRPGTPTPAVPIHMTVNNSGTIGSLQTGTGLTAYVQQQWVEGDTSALREGLDTLRCKLAQALDIEPDIRVKLIADVDKASLELQQEKPSKGKLLSWLNGIGGVIGAVGSVQPAYEAVKTLARVLGLSP